MKQQMCMAISPFKSDYNDVVFESIRDGETTKNTEQSDCIQLRNWFVELVQTRHDLKCSVITET